MREGIASHAGADTLTLMTDRNDSRRTGATLAWTQLAAPTAEQSQRFIAESLAQLLADLLRSIIGHANPSAGASEHMITRYRELATACGAAESSRNISLSISRGSLAKRCVAWLKLLLTAPADGTAAPALREFVDALALFPALFDVDPSARSRRARLTWLLTHDRRLDASPREAANALIEACEHLGLLLWPDAETA